VRENDVSLSKLDLYNISKNKRLKNQAGSFGEIRIKHFQILD